MTGPVVPPSPEVAEAAYLAEVEDLMRYLHDFGVPIEQIGPRLVRVIERFVDTQISEAAAELRALIERIERGDA